MIDVWVHYSYNLHNGDRGVLCVANCSDPKNQFVGRYTEKFIKSKWVRMSTMPNGLIVRTGVWDIHVKPAEECRV